MSSSSPRPPERPNGVLKSPQDLGAGLLLLAIAAIAFFGSLNLRFGQLSGVGPGLMPRSVALLVAAFGLLLVVLAFVSEGSLLERWPLRGPIFVLGAAIVFSWTIRPLGLIVAGPLAILTASLADRHTRPLEAIAFAAVLTAFCIGLFSYLLRLPIPIMPTSIPYPLNLWS